MLFRQRPSKGSPNSGALASIFAVESHLSLLENDRDCMSLGWGISFHLS